MAVLFLGLATFAPAADIIARVGLSDITSRDIELRQRVEAAYAGAKPPTTTATLVMLVNDALVHEVARRHGALPSEEEIHGLAAHADATSRNPELLDRVKRAFDGDQSAYRRLYLAPRATENVLREWFARHESILRDEAFTSGPAAFTYSDWLRRAQAEATVSIRADFLEDLRRIHPGVWWLGHAMPLEGATSAAP